MKTFLMYQARDFDAGQDLPPHAAALMKDLELTIVLRAMAAGDTFLFEVARTAVLCSLTGPAEIIYRQQVLADCLAQPQIVREIYDLAVATIEGERRGFYPMLFRDTPEMTLYRCVQVLDFFASQLKALRHIADEHAAGFRSPGFQRLFTMIREELSDEYFSEISRHLAELKFRRGTLISAELGTGAKGVRHVLRRAREQSWLERITPSGHSAFSFQIAERDESGMQALSDLKDRGLSLVAGALAQSTDHILSFFAMLRTELAFYVGCLNLHARLTVTSSSEVCFPVPLADGPLALRAQGLYDAALCLRTGNPVVGSDLAADHASLIMITGANQGGKSTFLRAVGVAWLLMQCGLFVPASAFTATVCTGVFTHYKREEDTTMRSGKLDEELARMSGIVDQIAPGCILLCNESFASTNEREGSEIARQVVRALLDRGIRVLFVTHLYDLAQGLYRQQAPDSLFLRAGWRPDGTRTFQIGPGEPLPTSHGEDVYQSIFGTAPRATG